MGVKEVRVQVRNMAIAELMKIHNYIDNQVIKGELDADAAEEMKIALLDAVDATSKQIPKKLIDRGKRLMDLTQYDCPTCGKGGFVCSCSKYCNTCGQALMWVE